MFSFNHPVEIKFGAGIFTRLNEFVVDYDYARIVVAASNSQVENGVVNLIESLLGDKVRQVVTGIEANPTLGNVESITSAMYEHDAHAVIAAGGGSVMDASKAAAAAYMQGIGIEALLNHTDFSKALPIIAIPSTSGSASEVTASSVISDKENGLKVPLSGRGLYPKLAIVDPELTYTCPPNVTAVSGIDVICHALDCLGSVKSNPISDALAIRAAKLAFENLAVAYEEPENREARTNMSLASVLAGIAFSQTGTSASHAMSYYLTSHFDIPHGEACAFSLDEWFIKNAEVNPELHQHAKDIGFDDAAHLSVRFNDLKRKVGLRLTLDELGISRGKIENIAEESLKQANMKNNIAQLDKPEIVQLLERK